ncbi:hypothetical protein [Methanococcoides methylutens]|uniref:Archaeal Type IV pilin N-terminal domain-containing protein n=1 Tax=Methanococcoides methylutens MM1 TaxID=1434104 RepID=A0A0E3X0J1_METMT|nr:hypothetical protein [Methanococcoides methylutens]AKB85755.1 hypothetical protein MCMEM_1702 [Methanococcoides methylutens MM1]
MARNNIFDSESAVSEVVDVVLILGIMLIAITVISVAGFPALQNMQDSGHQENIRQSFIVLGENVNKVVFNLAPSQSVELKMYGGSIGVIGDSKLNLSVQTWNETSLDKEYEGAPTGQLMELRNEREGTSISYENTAVWAKYQTGQPIMVREPQFVFDGNTLIIPFVPIQTGGSTSGEGLIRIITDSLTSEIYSYQNVSAVNISVTSPYYIAWDNYLNETLEMQTTLNTTSSTVDAHKDYDENIDVYVLKSTVSMTIE